ncbi:MAG: TIGR00159 family protein [Desulfobacteraceae bacterium]|nr:TIGR00159 family protein [Desulfobacteraceae bacterium]
MTTFYETIRFSLEKLLRISYQLFIMHPLAILTELRFQDVLDILFLTVVTYHLYLWFRRTKAFKALIGLFGLGIVYTAARSWGLFLTTWVFQILWQVLVILLIILFQSEIRQALEKFNPLQAIGLRKISRPEAWIPGFAKAIFSLAKRKIGALIIIERTDSVEGLIIEGQPLDSEPSPELLLSIFQKDSPLHDGGVLIKDGRIIRVACYLPLSSDEGLPKEWGTRHRAALGLSERCDAWVVAVSEERGEVSLARSDNVKHIETQNELSQFILDALRPITPAKTTWKRRIQSIISQRWHVKLGTLALVCLIWLLFAGQQNFVRTLKIPLDPKKIPETLVMVNPVKPEVAITVQGLRKDASTLDEKDVQIDLDLSMAHAGKRAFRITRDQVILPNDRLHVVNISPNQIQFEFKQRKSQ